MRLYRHLLGSILGVMVVLVATCCSLTDVPVNHPDKNVLIHTSECRKMPWDVDATVVAPITRMVLIDETFTFNELAAIIDGLKAWETATGGRVRWSEIVVVPQEELNWPVHVCANPKGLGVLYIRRAWSPDQDIVDIDIDSRKEHPGEDLVTLAYTTERCGTKYIALVADRQPFDEDRRVALVIHEVGHALGLEHDVNLSNTVMYRRLDQSATCITGLDLEQFCRVNGCAYKEPETDVPTEAGSSEVPGDALDR